MAAKEILGAGYGLPAGSVAGRAARSCTEPFARAKGETGEIIRFGIGQCSLGSILVAATAQGICAIELGDAPSPLIEKLKNRFPDAELKGGGGEIERIVTEAAALVEEPKRAFNLPLDIRGTAFQQKVWEVLRRIPPGQTMTYGEVAERAGRPSAVRAVASAIAANTLAVVIPCHRVIRTGGVLAGYRWGVERKAALLKREGAL